jgi:hypothetical protein
LRALRNSVIAGFQQGTDIIDVAGIDLFLFGGVALYTSFFAKGGPADTGWTIYPPLSEKLGGDGVEDRRRGARAVRDVPEREDDLVLRVRDGGDDRLLEPLRVSDPRSRLVGEGRPRMDRDVLVAGDLDGAQHQDLRAGGGHLEHLLVRDAVELARVRDDSWVGREDPVDVGVDLARAAERGSERDDERAPLVTAPADA